MHKDYLIRKLLNNKTINFVDMKGVQMPKMKKKRKDCKIGIILIKL